jgi:hypothetical protein
MKNPDLNIILPPSKLDNTKVGGKTAEQYSAALRVYDEEMGKVFANFINSTKIPNQDARSTDGIFRLIALDSLDEALA